MRDKDVRTAVRQQLAAEHDGNTSTKIVEEMGIWSGTVRIDIAVINGELSGFELKSDSDTLERLPLQAEIYSRVFDKVTLVAGRRHCAKAASLVPQWWGLTQASEKADGIELEALRPCSGNPAPEPYLVAELLGKHEALAVLEKFGLARGWRSKRIKDIHCRLAHELPFSVLAEQVRSSLKARTDWLSR